MGLSIAKSMPLALLVVCSACGTNPVTGKRELQFVSEQQEIEIGQKNYAPSRQAEGGDLAVMPELTAYVSEVGRKLAAVSIADSKRDLPYEFAVLDNSVPNAWAMPGGKIAVNRGLLTELKSEAELAAVLGHEIVHAAARHGAKAQERGTLMQAGMAVAQIGAAVSGVDQNVAGIALAGGGFGLQAVQMKYGRDQELEADSYGMKYMKLAGYDPAGAVSLQETFVRISNDAGGKAGFFDRMFASHPPSTERVEKNKTKLQELGPGGEVGASTYQTRIAALLKAKPAYDKYDQATAALKKKDFANATKLTEEASALFPSEGRFHELRGEIEVAQKRYREALPHYERAIQLNPNYFGSYLGGGIAQYEAGNKQKGTEWIKRSHDLLPTQPASYYLGKLAKERGDTASALQFFKSAATTESGFGELAAREYVTLDLHQNAERYIATDVQLDPAGQVIVILQSRSPVPLSEIQVTLYSADDFGRLTAIGAPLQVRGTLAPNGRLSLNPGLGAISAQKVLSLRARVDAAKVDAR